MVRLAVMAGEPIGVLMRRHMDEHNLTQLDVAAALQVAQPRVSEWLRGERAPAENYAPALAAFLGIDVTDVRDAIALQRKRGSNLADQVASLTREVAEIRRMIEGWNGNSGN